MDHYVKAKNYIRQSYTWSVAYALFASGLTRKLYLWLTFGPLIASIIGGLEGSLSIEIVMPNSILLMYLSALILLISGLYWNVNAPIIIKEYPVKYKKIEITFTKSDLNNYLADTKNSDLNLENDIESFEWLWVNSNLAWSGKRRIIFILQAVAILFLFLCTVLNLVKVINTVI